jgi:hypothetical protein
MISIIMLCLKHCKFLQVLVVACSIPSHIEMIQERLDSSRDMLPGDPLFLVLASRPPVTSDPRFLVLLVRDYYHDMGWEAWARGSGEDFWAAADRHVRKRRSGATNGVCAFLILEICSTAVAFWFFCRLRRRPWKLLLKDGSGVLLVPKLADIFRSAVPSV